MTLFFAALITTFLLGSGGRDQVLIAALATKLGKRASLLAAGLVATVLASLAITWLAKWIGSGLGERAASGLVVLALLLAGMQMVWVQKSRIPAEPTRSLGAITLGFVILQIADPVRLAILGLVLISPDNATAIGAALGAALALTAGWLAKDRLPVELLLRLRKWLGMALIVLVGVGAITLV